MDIRGLLEQLRSPGDDGPPETIYDDIAEAYDGAVEIRDAKINEQEAAIQESQGLISQLKSANYDLLMATSGETDPDPEPDADTDPGVEDLFE